MNLRCYHERNQPGIPPNPPRPKGEAFTSGGGAGVGVVVGAAPADGADVVDGALDDEEDEAAEAAPPCLITKCIVIPSLML